jgi:hypothetical protein
VDNLLEAVASMRLGLHFIEKNIPSSTWVFDLVPTELNPQVCFEFQQGVYGIYMYILYVFIHLWTCYEYQWPRHYFAPSDHHPTKETCASAGARLDVEVGHGEVFLRETGDRGR